MFFALYYHNKLVSYRSRSENQSAETSELASLEKRVRRLVCLVFCVWSCICFFGFVERLSIWAFSYLHSSTKRLKSESGRNKEKLRFSLFLHSNFKRCLFFFDSKPASSHFKSRIPRGPERASNFRDNRLGICSKSEGVRKGTINLHEQLGFRFGYSAMAAFYILSWIFFVGLISLQGNADPVEDKRALLDFVNNLPHSRSLNWDSSSPVCSNWTGVTCSEDGSHVIAVRLPGIGFHGPIPANTISRLSALQILSLRSNAITGYFPSDFSNLRNLSYLYLQYNKFSGPLPVHFSVWKNLTIVNLSNNGFNGTIPASLSNLTHLEALNLANNSLSGKIPDLNFHGLQHINLSDNHLSGSIPKSLIRFPISAFDGNNVSIPDFAPCKSPVVTPSSEATPKSGARKLNETALLGIIVTGCVLGMVSFALYMIVCFSRRKKYEISGKLGRGDMSPEKVVSRSEDANNRLFFFEGCNSAFDLEDLLRASAEVLGKGTFGAAYKAVLEDATTVVVKRLKEVSVGKRDFEQQMEVVGNIKHENVVELKAYYHSKDEKLMVYDYFSQGSISAILHGKRGEDKTPLDWDARIRIAIGAARGLAHIHSESGGKFVHGNIKSSNIFLNSKQFGCVSDLGLATIMSPLAPPISRAAGYRAPEVTDTRKATQASDVYSFGVVLLELLTGKSPIHTIGGDEIVHLVRWVHSVVREEWTAEVFDIELMKYPNIEEELVEMLQIAMTCVARVPDQRPAMLELVKLIENVRRIDVENRLSSENRSESSTPQPPAIDRES